MTRSSWAFALLGAFLTVLCATSAFAQTPKLDAAERAFAAGDQAYAAGQYLVAARAYENAYELHPVPSITFSIAQAYRRHYFEDLDVTWLDKAQAAYRRYLEEQPQGGRRAHAITHLGNIALLLSDRANQQRGPDEARYVPTTELLVSSATPGASASIDGGPARDIPVTHEVTAGPHRVTVSAPGFFESELDVMAPAGRLTIVPIDLVARPGSLRVIAEQDAAVWIDGRLVGHAPLSAATEVPAGTHTVAVTAPGRRTASRTVTIERGALHTVRVDLETSDARVAAHWTLASAGAFGLAGGAMTILALVSESQAEDARSGLAEGRALTPAEAATYNDALARRDLGRTLALTSFSLSAAAGVTGALIFVLDDPIPVATTRTVGSTYGLGFRGTF